MHKEAQEELRVIFRVAVFEYAKNSSVTQTCRDFQVPRSSFYRWKKRYDQEGRSGLYRKRPIAQRHPRDLMIWKSSSVLISAHRVEWIIR